MWRWLEEIRPAAGWTRVFHLLICPRDAPKYLFYRIETSAVQVDLDRRSSRPVTLAGRRLVIQAGRLLRQWLCFPLCPQMRNALRPST